MTSGEKAGHVTWVQILCAKCLHFHFEFAEGQNTKIPSKYQNAFEAQNAKISAVSAPILTGKAAFFSIFRDLSEKSAENASKAQNLHKTFAPKFGNFGKMRKMLVYFGILAASRCILVFWYFACILHFHFDMWKNLQPV